MLDWIPQRFSRSMVLSMEGLRYMYFEKSPQRISDVPLKIRTIDRVPLAHFLWWENGVPEKFMDLLKVKQLQNSRTRTQTRVCWFPAHCPLYYTMIPPRVREGDQLHVRILLLGLLTKDFIGQEDSFSWVSRHSVSSVQSPARGPFYSEFLIQSGRGFLLNRTKRD